MEGSSIALQQIVITNLYKEIKSRRKINCNVLLECGQNPGLIQHYIIYSLNELNKLKYPGTQDIWEIDKLKQPYRNVIEMREIQKMQYKDIACAMGKDVKFSLTIEDDFIIDLPVEISKFYSLTDKYGNEVEFEMIKGEQFFTKIKINHKGTFNFSGREPKNLSTIKSQIRNSRNLLIKASKKEFELLDEMYLS